FTDDSFREMLHDFKPDTYGDDWADFAKRVHYDPADSTEASEWPALTKRIKAVAHEHGIGSNILFYLSMAPQFFEPIINHVGASGLVIDGKRMVPIDKD